MITKTQKIIALVTVIVILALYFFFDHLSKNSPTVSTETVTTTTTNDTKNNFLNTSNKTEQTSVKQNKVVSQSAPDLNRPIIVYSGANISPEAKVLATEKVSSLENILKSNPIDLGTWIDLAMYQKMGGDYIGASISLQYVTKLAPTNYVVFGNLGDLYAHFLKDNTKSEMYYKEAISRGPTQSYLYTQLAEVYRDIFNDYVKALAVVNQGLTQLPNDPNLLQLKTSLK